MSKYLISIIYHLIITQISFAEPGFFTNQWQAKNAPTLLSGTLDASVPESPEATFIIDAKEIHRPILPTLLGNNANFYSYKLNKDSAGLEHLRQSGLKNMRLPGGNGSNEWLWDGQIHWTLHESYDRDLINGPFGNFIVDTEEQISIADSIGAMVQPCVNFSLSRYIQGPDSVQKAASYAADWVRQLNITEGRNVKFWEVGNENYGHWQSGYIVNGDTITGTMYGQAFRHFADSMHAVDPSIKIGAVVYEGNDAPGTGDWNHEVIPLVAGYADFLAVHQYFTWASDMNSITVGDVLGALPKTWETIESLDSTVGVLTSLGYGGIPIAMTEYNVRAGRKNSQHISAIFNAMALGEYARAGYGLVNLWNITNNFSDGVDHGMLTRNDPSRDEYNPNPTFYSYFLFNKMMGDQLLKINQDEALDVRVYPSSFSSGELGIMVVNQGSLTRKVELDLQNFTPEGTLLSYHLTASSPESREILLNGQSENVYSGPLNYNQIPPILRNFAGNPTLEIQPYSVNFYRINNDKSVMSIHAQGSTKVTSLPRGNFHNQASFPSEAKPKNIRFFRANGDVANAVWAWSNGSVQITSQESQPISYYVEFE